MNRVKPLQIGVSACLLGQRVRYDGSHRYNKHVINSLGDQFQLLAICPEVAIGLGVPRAAIQLKRINKQNQLLAVANPEQNHTVAMINFSQRCLQHYALSGLVLKDRSPSCAVGNATVYDLDELSFLANGLFTETMASNQPELPIISAEQLQQPGAVVSFSAQIRQFAARQHL